MVLRIASIPCAASAAEPVVLTAAFDRPAGVIRPLHGINKGPLASGGLVDVSDAHRALGIPWTRLHDCHWPNPDVVDIHAIFGAFEADPERAESYDFSRTDEYLAAVRATGAQIIYRLGESIEHSSTKRFVHPPRSAEKWAQICLGIIRHYNEGWSDGFHHGIRYWEIWNEPENRPAMWSGSDDDYFQLYKTTARAIRSRYPELKIGGPAVGDSGELAGGEFRPSAFVTGFLDFCRRESVPLDFFSWHCYTADPSELVARARALRDLLDRRGFAKTESHLNEWNYLPGNSWRAISRSSAAGERQHFYEQMAGAPGAAFVAAALLELQDAPVDMCNFFHGELGGFGLFNEHGVPTKNHHAFAAFRLLLRTPKRIETSGSVSGQLAFVAGLSEGQHEAVILVSNYALPQGEFRLALQHLPWTGRTLVETRFVDETHSLEIVRTESIPDAKTTIPLHLPKPALALITLRPASAPGSRPVDAAIPPPSRR